MSRAAGPARRARSGARGAAPTRQAEATRRALIEAATAVFAEHGFAAGSIRAITRKAKANQAAITYHFGGKEGLYAEVLRSAVAALGERGLDAESAEALPREEALRRLLRQLLAPLARRDRLGRYVRIFGWESVRPSPVFEDLMAREPPPVFLLTQKLVRRFMPADAPPHEVALTAFWLIQQPIALVRTAGHLARPPFGLAFDASSVERLVDVLARLSLEGLSGRAPRAAPQPQES